MTMNYSFLDPDRSGFPDHIVASAKVRDIITTKFSRKGKYLAAGASNGIIWILAMDSFSPILQLMGHTSSIVSLGFSSNSRFLVSGSVDGVVLLWELKTSKVLHQFQFSYPIIQATFIPNNDQRLVVLCLNIEPIIISLFKHPPKITPLKISDQSTQSLDVEAQRWCDQLFDFSAAGFDVLNRFLILGTATGLLATYDLHSSQFCHIEHLARTTITQILCHPNGQDMLLNCKNQLKLFEIKDESARLSFHYITRFPAENEWLQCTFNPNGNLIVACSARDNQHQLQVWEREGERHSTLLGPGQFAQGVDWHPTAPTLLSIEAGVLLLWEPSYQQKWSGFEPKFIELTTNEIVQEEEAAYDLPYASPSHEQHLPFVPYTSLNKHIDKNDSEIKEIDIINVVEDEEITLIPNLEDNSTTLPSPLKISFEESPNDAVSLGQPASTNVVQERFQSPKPQNLPQPPEPIPYARPYSPYHSPNSPRGMSPGPAHRGNPGQRFNQRDLSPDASRFHRRRSPSRTPPRNFSPRFVSPPSRRYNRSPSFPEPYPSTFPSPFRNEYFEDESIGSPRNNSNTSPYSRQGPHLDLHHRPGFEYSPDQSFQHQHPRDNFEARNNFDPRRNNFNSRRDNFEPRRDNFGSRRNNFHSRRNHFDSRQDGYDNRRENCDPRRDRFGPYSPTHETFNDDFSYRRGSSRPDFYRQRGRPQAYNHNKFNRFPRRRSRSPHQLESTHTTSNMQETQQNTFPAASSAPKIPPESSHPIPQIPLATSLSTTQVPPAASLLNPQIPPAAPLSATQAPPFAPTKVPVEPHHPPKSLANDPPQNLSEVEEGEISE